MMRDRRLLAAVLMTGLAVWQTRALAADTQAPPDAIVRQMFHKDIGVPDKELLMLTVAYLPGGASLPHRHDAEVFVYVLEGKVKMQVAGGPLVVLAPGETFYESPSDVHVVSANASQSAPAKILVVIVKTKGAPVSRAATAQATP